MPKSSHAQINKIKSFYAAADRTTKAHTIAFIQPSMDLIDDYSSLKQIVLIRHGEPSVSRKGWFSRKEAMRFIFLYDSVGVEPIDYLPLVLHDGDVQTIHTSTINRAKHTASMIFGDCVDYEEDALFREFERSIIPYPNVKMPLKFWLRNSRLVWSVGGHGSSIESYKAARQRAKVAANKLIQYAEDDKKAVLVAHGLLNRQIMINLKKQGWTVVRNGGRGYLATNLLVKID